MLWLLVSAFLIVSSACQSTRNSTGKADTLEVAYEKYTLDNGLDVILNKEDSDPIVAVAILFQVGSNREKPGRTGFAHFFEHMLFQNSENVPKGAFFTTIEELGGDFNGGTWEDGTIYYEVVPKDALELILWMESDRMGFMINTVTEAVLENEKQVVKNEKRQVVDNQPYGHSKYVIRKALYPEDHPYNWEVIGTLEDLQAATIADVKEFYDRWYGPNNATMVIAGDFDTQQTKDWIEKYFGEIPSKKEITPIEPRPAKIDSVKSFFHEDNFAQLPELRLVWPSVEDGHPDMYPLRYLAELLSDGKRAPLYKEIVEKQKLAPAVYSYNSENQIASEFTIQVRANPGIDLDSVKQAVFEALKQFEQKGIDDKDMERIKNSQETAFYNGISSLLNKAFQLTQYNEFRGDPDLLNREVDKILAVKKEDIIRVYERYLKDKPFVMTSFVPQGQPELAVAGAQRAEVVEEPIVQQAEATPLKEEEADFEKTPSRIDRSIPPALGTPPIVNAPEIWTGELDNGLVLFGIENSELPLVEFSLVVKGGMLLDKPEKIGVANLISDVMMEGTAGKTPEELEDAIGQLGSQISMSTTSEYITINGSCLSRNFEKTIDLFKEILLSPRWDEREFERIKSSTLADIQQAVGQPATVAWHVFYKLIYGKDHMLSNATEGTSASVEAITIDDLKAYYHDNFSPNISAFHIAGNVSRSRVVQALSDVGKEWGNREVALPELPEPNSIDDPAVYFVDIPYAKQSVLRIGAPSVKGNHEDFYAIKIVNEPLGGGTSGRLFQQLREERGYTYGAQSGIPRRINHSYFIALSSVRTNVTLESVALFKEIMENYQEGFSQEDLERTKNTLIKSNAIKFETLGDKRSILETISTYDLPLDYLDQQQEQVATMTLQQAKSYIDKYINPGKMIYVVVGDKATQFERLKNLDLKGPILTDKEGVPLMEVLN